jgi:hypothetical protein
LPIGACSNAFSNSSSCSLRSLMSCISAVSSQPAASRTALTASSIGISTPSLRRAIVSTRWSMSSPNPPPRKAATPAWPAGRIIARSAPIASAALQPKVSSA